MGTALYHYGMFFMSGGRFFVLIHACDWRGNTRCHQPQLAPAPLEFRWKHSRCLKLAQGSSTCIEFVCYVSSGRISQSGAPAI